MPSSFRAALTDQSFQGIVLFRSSTHECLEGFSMSYMEELGKRLDAFDLFSEQQDDLATSIFGEAVPLPFDGDGRVILPSSLTQEIKLQDKACFVGLGLKFQIWAPEVFEGRRKKARASVKEKGMTIPNREGGGS